MKDSFAIYEILKFAGFRSRDEFDPGAILKSITDSSGDTISGRDISQRKYTVLPYALPSEYQRLEQPAFKFDDGSTYYDAISMMTKRTGKIFYFDQFGIAHFEDYLDMITKIILGKEDLIPLFKFTQNPIEHVGQMIFNKVDHSYNVSDVYNHLRVFSTTPDRELLIKDEMNWDTLDTPSVEGFMGYRKVFFQQEGMFGSEVALRRILNFYRTMFKPPVVYKFETYGLPIRALDIVSVNGHSARVMKVSHEIDPSENKWWMNIETERFKPVVENFNNEK